jgi:hypothetical protein
LLQLLGISLIFSAVPVFGMNESYIALLAEGQDDIWHPETYPWWETLQKTVLFCSGPGRSHVTQMEMRKNFWYVPGLLRIGMKKTIDISLDPHGQVVATVVASHEPELLGQYHMMACVRDIFFNPAPKRDKQGLYSGPFKLWVEWMEWSSMRGLDHFLLYSFEGTDLAARKVMQPYVDAGLATRVRFNFFLESELIRQGYVANDCLFRAKNHAKWLATCVDVDEYIAFPGPVKFFDWDEVVKLEGVQQEQVASLSIPRIRFARPRPKAPQGLGNFICAAGTRND